MSGQAWTWLTPRSTSDVGRVGIAATGQHLTPEDIKHALGGLPVRPFRFGMAAFLGDRYSWTMLEGFVVELLRWQADAGGWITKRQHVEILNRMAQLMVWEAVSAQSRNETLPGEMPMPKGSAAILCPLCLGRGTDVHGRICSVCGGSRRFVLDDSKRADAIGMHRSNWSRTWRDRYAEAMEHPRRWEAQAISHVRRKLRTEDA
jgi:hypothetical protein